MEKIKILFLSIILSILSTKLIADMPYYLDFKMILNNSIAGKKAQDSLQKKLKDGIDSKNAKERSLQEEEKKIILITDLVDQRLRKEQEIEYYEKELHKIQERLSYLYKEKTLTETILAIIQTEKVIDIREYMQAKLEKKE